MQITSVKPYCPSFGYDKQANDKLKKTLTNSERYQTPGTIENSMLHLQQMCIDSEDALAKYEESNGKPPFLFSEMTEALIDMKRSLISILQRTYHDRSYIQKEYEHYNRTATLKDKNKFTASYNWEKDMAEMLHGALCKTEPSSNSTPYQPAYQDKKVTSGIDEFSPTKNSPAGFQDIGGMAKLKEELYDSIIFPIKNPELAKQDFEEYGKEYPSGILLYGPPGCGKTYITQALASEAGTRMFSMKMGDIGSKYIHETSKKYQEAFDAVAREATLLDKPCILFIDEFDGFGKGRSSKDDKHVLEETGTLLNLIQEAKDKNIIVIAATNKFDLLDDAMKRRFDTHVYVGLPDFTTRREILLKNLEKCSKGATLSHDDKELDKVAKALEGFSNSNICTISAKASDRARKDGRRDISAEDYLEVIQTPEAQNLKLKESSYQADTRIKKIGFMS